MTIVQRQPWESGDVFSQIIQKVVMFLSRSFHVSWPLEVTSKSKLFQRCGEDLLPPVLFRDATNSTNLATPGFYPTVEVETIFWYMDDRPFAQNHPSGKLAKITLILPN